MKFRFTYHAQYRMEERGISALDIKSIINHPDFYKIEESGTILCKKMIVGKGNINVVYRKIKNQHLIITIYYEK